MATMTMTKTMTKTMTTEETPVNTMWTGKPQTLQKEFKYDQTDTKNMEILTNIITELESLPDIGYFDLRISHNSEQTPTSNSTIPNICQLDECIQLKSITDNLQKYHFFVNKAKGAFDDNKKNMHYSSSNTSTHRKTDMCYRSSYKNRRRRYITNKSTQVAKFKFSMGFRFFYWNYYKNNRTMKDDAHLWSQTYLGSPPANRGYFVTDWYVAIKYQNLKEELLNNGICHILLAQWDNLMIKAAKHKQTNTVREIFCPRQTTAVCYDLMYQCVMTLSHLVAQMVYCNYDTLQSKFSETYRLSTELSSTTETYCLSINETYASLKHRHSEYHFMGKLLRENVECFGMSMYDCDGVRVRLYHGLDQIFTFSTVAPYIKGPMSSTTDYAVAVNFAGHAGMVLEIGVDSEYWRVKWKQSQSDHDDRIACFDCRFLSDYVNEQEIFTIGGLYQSQFNTIIMVESAINYVYYIKGLKQMTYCMIDIYDYDMMPNSTMRHSANGNLLSGRADHEEQMVWRLLSHELHRYYPTGRHCYEFRGCPQYFRQILHNHCLNVRTIRFKNRRCDVRLLFLVYCYDYGWINLNKLLTVFPNTERILYDAQEKNLSFLTNVSIYHSTLSYIQNNIHSNIQQIEIIINKKYCAAMIHHIQMYRRDFRVYNFTIDVYVINNVYTGTNIGEIKSECKIIISRFGCISKYM
eukprot:28591_1